MTDSEAAGRPLPYYGTTSGGDAAMVYSVEQQDWIQDHGLTKEAALALYEQIGAGSAEFAELHTSEASFDAKMAGAEPVEIISVSEHTEA